VAERRGEVVVVLGPAIEAGAKSATDDDVSLALARLGADVREGSLFAEIDELVGDEDEARCLVVDGAARPDLAPRALRHARKFDATSSVPALVALPARFIQQFDPSSGFDDFIVLPATGSSFLGELYARLRKLEWAESEFSTNERMKIGRMVIDRALHEVTLDARRVELTAREFALLVHFAQNRGRVLARDVLLARVWGPRYEGGARTVDIHVRRLRAKLGDALPIETLRGAGYLLRATTPHGADTNASSDMTPRGKLRVVR
jgi:DNA-binding response OmpR family regulator